MPTRNNRHTQNARLTDEELKSCQHKDFMKQLNCNEKLLKKKRLFDKIAMEEHCVANKCPQMHEFQEKIKPAIVKSFLQPKGKLKSKFAAIDECLHKNCSKETEDNEKKRNK